MNLKLPNNASAPRFITPAQRNKRRQLETASQGSDLPILREKVEALEGWRTSTEADLKEIREVIAQVKLLITLSLGGGGLSLITLIITLARLVQN